MQAYINSHFEYSPLKLFSYFSLVQLIRKQAI